MPAPRTSIPWWLNESLDVVQRCFASDWDLLTEGQRERFMRELAAMFCFSRHSRYIPGILAWLPSEDVQAARKEARLDACQYAREIFGRML